MKPIKLIVPALGLLLVTGLMFLWTPDIDPSYLRAKYGSGDSQFISLPDGTQVHLRDRGPRDALPLVLLHGSNASLHTWEDWARRLADTYRVISIDLPGHGLTSRTVEDAYDRAGMARFVHRVANALDLERFVLGGNSMGGAVTLTYALAHPERLLGLILVDNSGVSAPEDDDSETDLPLAFKLAADPSFAWIIESVTPRGLAAQGLTVSFYDPSFVTQAMIDQYWELTRHPGTRYATGKRFQASLKRPPGDIPVEGIKLPTLILWGDHDLLIPVAAGEETHKRIEGSRLIVYENIGHIPMEEAADQSAGDARAFLETLPD